MNAEIRVQVKFMGGLGDLAACREVVIALPPGTHLAELVHQVSAQFGPSLAGRLASNPSDPFGYHVVAVVDGRFCGEPSSSPLTLDDGATVVFMEPVAGGAERVVE